MVVNKALRTTNKRIWAAGDLTGHRPFTHVAGIHGSLAASNAVLGLRRTVAPDLVPRVTYTQPRSRRSAHRRVRSARRVRTITHDEVDLAVTEGRTDGHTTIVLDKRGTVVGASIVGPRAGEMLAEAMLAGQAGLRARTVAGAMHAYPAWSDGVWKAALAQARTDLDGPVVSRMTRALARTRRWWVRPAPAVTRCRSSPIRLSSTRAPMASRKGNDPGWVPKAPTATYTAVPGTIRPAWPGEVAPAHRRQAEDVVRGADARAARAGPPDGREPVAAHRASSARTLWAHLRDRAAAEDPATENAATARVGGDQDRASPN